MSAAIAHEINQPLVAIKNYALAARRRLAGELLDKIGGQASRAGEVLQTLRTMVKKHQSEVTKSEIVNWSVRPSNWCRWKAAAPTSAAANAMTGSLDIAGGAMARVRELDPNLRQSNVKDRLADRQPELIARRKDALLKARLE